jgi:hypothetical protein
VDSSRSVTLVSRGVDGLMRETLVPFQSSPVQLQSSPVRVR